MAATIAAITPDGWQMGRGYQHATVAEGATRLVNIAGQVAGSGGLPPAAFSKDIVAQFQGALTNFKTVLESAGGSAADLTSMTIYTTDVDAYRRNLKGIGAAWIALFGEVFPAMTLVGVTELFDAGATIEIDGTAVLG
jgi:enamine deaminase RidA (YjgF/YER057c/UK114 family)